MPDSNTMTRFAECVQSNLGGHIEAMYPITTHIYDSGASESHYLVLVKQPINENETHWCVHRVGIHTVGQVGMVGSGAYHMSNEDAARDDFRSRIGVPS